MKKTVFLVGMTSLLFACNSENSDFADGKVENPNKIGKELNCNLLEKYEKDYSALLTKEEMASVYPIDFEKAKENLRNSSYGEYTFNWPSNRPDLKMEVSGMKMNIPDQNSMGIKIFSFSADEQDMKKRIDRFDMAYKQLSDEELNKINKNLEKQDAEIKSTGKDMMKVREKMSWEFVNGLGSSSWYKWNDKFGGELVVLAGKAKFEIIVKISDDPKENLEIAKKLAEKVIAKC